MSNRPIGVLRTLPYFGASDSEHDVSTKSRAYQEMLRSLKAVEEGTREYCLIAFPAKPTAEVLRIYLVIGGQVRVRGNIAEWRDGTGMKPLKCWDNTERRAKWWAVMTAPISWPPQPVLLRGFQGFRYLREDLW